MRSFHPSDVVRAAEAPLLASLPEGTLMRRAAYGLARVVASELRERTGGIAGRRVSLLVGSGDNGGDALWAGTFLRHRGVSVTALLLDPDRVHPAGLRALRKAGGRIVQATPEHVGDPDLALDGIVGISGRGPLRPAAAAVVDEITAPIIAVDTPSGVDPDTGAVDGPAITAAVTVTFGAYKPVHALAAARCGRVELVDIGLTLPAAGLVAAEPSEIGAIWPVPGAEDDKYSQGVVGIRAGSARYPGAGVLCTGAAVAATSGMVRYAGSGASEVLARFPEVVVSPSVAETGRVQAWVVGPGAGTDDEACANLRDILATDLPVLVDADGLTLLAREPGLVRGRSAPTLLTPHAGEFARLTGQRPEPDRVAAVRSLAADWGVHVLLKGRATLVARPDGHVFVNDAGGSWASTAGAGDVLAGVIGSLLSSGMPVDLAAAAGARAHALAANLAAQDPDSPGAAPISASAILSRIGDSIRLLRTHIAES
ncbi:MULTISPECIES: NAD(P)H-hydrate dehydratase [Rhodococcus]|uniref:Bifunctional NAD(P)H-hydrate repair enzyme n=1 Tax=Rhodococcus rhodochrous TaxID=1829 RepID=A0AAW4XD03_RHORH|nr:MULTISPECIES: NAD(P)H-hydrate dehydratase [Rhodococcus]MCD2110635.1 NAD(P)H-hydrate dehydratase [Rhodococcus rhodochrous]QHG82709.1 NAD(P)H-hydrate dehydratase [Rhodococcus rhodochrous]QOH57610.1 NAD(P)H-hydrate dehydratase [Rhodococcus rhodochrous]WAL45229.1 NAD(P)H-hydrate dehydratase [Rhodococcus pyridinivorans]